MSEIPAEQVPEGEPVPVSDEDEDIWPDSPVSWPIEEDS